MIRILPVLFICFYSYASIIGIKDTKTSNVLRDYGKILTEFIVKNMEEADFYIETKSYSMVIQPSISWIGTEYSICLKLYSGTNYPIKIECATAKDGEELYNTLKVLLLRLGNFKLKDIPPKVSELLFFTRVNLKFKEYKVESQKGDVILPYKKVSRSGKTKNILNFGKVLVVLDSIYLNREQAKTLFKFLLENYKIKQILIKNF